jgi:hypothetical protein
MVSESLRNICNAIAYAIVHQFYEIKKYLDSHKKGVEFGDREYRDLIAACFVMAYCEISKSNKSGSSVKIIEELAFNDVYLQLSDMFSSVEELIDYVNGYTSLYTDEVCLMDSDRVVGKVVEGFIYDLPLNNDAAAGLVNEVINQSRILISKVADVLKLNNSEASKE